MGTTRYVTFSPALAWLLERPEVRDAAQASVARPGEAFADAVLTDPARLADLYRALAAESLALDTPAGASDGLIRIHRYVGGRAAVASAERAALQPAVASLVGLRDRGEINRALRVAADELTDVPTRERLLELAEYISTELTAKKRGELGQVVIDLVTPDPATPDPVPGPVHPKRPPGQGSGEPVVPVIPEDNPAVGLLDQVADAGSDAAVEFAKQAEYDPNEAAKTGAEYATEKALELTYGEAAVGEGAVGAGDCMLAEVLERVGERLGGLTGAWLGRQHGEEGCASPTPHAVDSALRAFTTSVHDQPVTELDLATAIVSLFGEGCIPCAIALQMLAR